MLLKLCLNLLVVATLGRHAHSDECSFHADIKPCTCQQEKDLILVSCTGLQNSEELEKAVQGLKGHSIHSLEVKESYIGDLPGSIFKDIQIEAIKLIYAKLNSIGDEKYPPFTGLEGSLKSLVIKEGFWDYDKPLTKPIKLDHLKKLKYLLLENNVISKLGDDWFQDGPRSLRHLAIVNGLVKEVGDHAFTGLKKLRKLEFTGNSVTLPRSALPRRPRNLVSLDLSENKIIELPKDMFENMRSLKNISLENNGLELIPEHTWKTVLPQLHLAFLDSNPLKCDSRMKWIVIEELNKKIKGKCALPEALNGKEIATLTVEELLE